MPEGNTLGVRGCMDAKERLGRSPRHHYELNLVPRRGLEPPRGYPH
jgi:hypothetical protein